MEREAECEAAEAVWMRRQAVSTRRLQQGLRGDADAGIHVRADAEAPWKPYVALLPLYSPRHPDDLPDCISGNQTPYKMDAYNDEDAEVKWLLSKPLCVLIVGKLQRDAAKLAQSFSRHWGSVCVEPDAVAPDLTQLVETELRSGHAPAGQLVALLMKKLLLSSEARHRGYVLAGLPYLPYADDDAPASTQLADLFSLPLSPDIIVHIAKHVIFNC